MLVKDAEDEVVVVVVVPSCKKCDVPAFLCQVLASSQQPLQSIASVSHCRSNAMPKALRPAPDTARQHDVPAASTPSCSQAARQPGQQQACAKPHLRVAHHSLHVLYPRARQRHEAVVDSDGGLPNDVQPVAQQQVIHSVDGPAKAVLYGQHCALSHPLRQSLRAQGGRGLWVRGVWMVDGRM